MFHFHGVCIFCLIPSILSAQINPGFQPRHYEVNVPANAPGWVTSTIHVKAGDFVLFESSDKIDLGKNTHGIPASGSLNPALSLWNRYDALHGALLCGNGDKYVSAASKYRSPMPGYVNLTQIPLSLRGQYDENSFTGNFFISSSDQTLRFIINDKKTDDNSGSLNVRVTVLTLGKSPVITAGYDLAGLVDKYKGVLPYCFGQDVIPQYAGKYGMFDGIYMKGKDQQGHYYLAINPLGPYNGAVEDAIKMMTGRISEIFPFAFSITDITSKDPPENTTVQLNHIYQITGYMEVKATEVSDYHFTFDAQRFHVLKGAAIHGLFKDQCGWLYMFQQGRGKPDEYLIQATGNMYGAPIMWSKMARNMRLLLQKENLLPHD